MDACRTGALAADECFVNLGAGGVLSEQSNPAGVVMMRNPSYQPGDILKLKAVKTGQLLSRHMRGPICVLSTQGERPIADKMSGGDYDGEEQLASTTYG